MIGYKTPMSQIDHDDVRERTVFLLVHASTILPMDYLGEVTYVECGPGGDREGFLETTEREEGFAALPDAPRDYSDNHPGRIGGSSATEVDDYLIPEQVGDDYEWCVLDPRTGARWHPSEGAAAGIAAYPDPAALTLFLCQNAPMCGAWR